MPLLASWPRLGQLGVRKMLFGGTGGHECPSTEGGWGQKGVSPTWGKLKIADASIV